MNDTCDYGPDVTSIVLPRVFDAFADESPSNNDLVECLFGHAGKLFDEATQLQNNWNRWYDATVGKWLSEDAIWDGTNIHAYVGNNPTTNVDPLGLCKEDGGGYSDLVYRGEDAGFVATPFRQGDYANIPSVSYAGYSDLVYRGEAMGMEATPFRLGDYAGQQMWVYADYSNLMYRGEADNESATPFRPSDYVGQQMWELCRKNRLGRRRLFWIWMT